ncbi:MAG: Uncharacterized protein G01um101431_987 [Parcubacteria group bacterium Gr01-1014_31]|nr:MAG: Uncharacterized protein G01um101431_987 [Parcubacteria group bacterium Gr01-1014_31]
MTKRTKIITIIVLALLVVLALVLVARAPRPARPAGLGQPSPLPGAGTTLPPAGGAVTQPVEPPVTKEPKTQATLEALAKTFAERYGSFSTDGGSTNLQQLQPLMTEQFAATARAAQQQLLLGDGFYGVTTKVLSAEIVALNGEETEAQIVVQTQRSETRTGAGRQQFYQKLTVTLLKNTAGWRVDGASWQ